MPLTSLAPQDAVHALYREHHGWLQSWLRKKLNDAYDAADLAQDTFVRVLRHRAELATLREPRAYLLTIAGRLVVNHYRRRSLERAYLEPLASLPPHAPSPEQRALIL
ncbi:heme uptake regulator, partial [Bordetella bronchiseptica Bbr77]